MSSSPSSSTCNKSTKCCPSCKCSDQVTQDVCTQDLRAALQALQCRSVCLLITSSVLPATTATAALTQICGTVSSVSCGTVTLTGVSFLATPVTMDVIIPGPGTPFATAPIAVFNLCQVLAILPAGAVFVAP